MWRAVLTIVAVLGVLAEPAGAADPAHATDTAAKMSTAAARGRLTALRESAGRWVAVGPWGRILYSTDAEHWTQAPVPVSADLVAVSFADARHGWAVGHEGTVLSTQDGGLTWRKQLDAERVLAIVRRTGAENARGGAAVPASLQADLDRLASLNGGLSFLDVLFLSEREGFAIGGFNLALRTTDGGENWVSLVDRTENPEGLHLYAMAAAGGEIYLVGERGFARRWSHERGRFEPMPVPYDGTLFGVLAFDRTVIAFGLEGKVLRSEDQGRTWSVVTLPSRASLTAGTRVGDAGIVLTSQAGDLWVSRDAGRSFTAAPVARRMPLYAIAPAGADTVVVAGAAGVQKAAFGRAGK
jgi:photosystem II stability/assembly factor-like uncharacterized protein